MHSNIMYHYYNIMYHYYNIMYHYYNTSSLSLSFPIIFLDLSFSG
jgi:hypothetical protein